MKLISKESLPSLLMILFSVLALIAANSPYHGAYEHLWATPFGFKLSFFSLDKPFSLWVNDGLMAIFFFLVALELKIHTKTGELKDPKKIINPFISALGGILVPGLVFYFFTKHDPSISHAWAIPMATDIAFAMGIVSLFGRRVSVKMRVFLLTLAVIDDIIAILIIGIFYGKALAFNPMKISIVLTFLLFFMNNRKIDRLWPYFTVGFFLWLSVLKSGLHPTLAGVILGFSIPSTNHLGHNLLKILEKKLTPYVYYLILPIFAFANMGIPLQNNLASYATHPLVLGIGLGLVFGKNIGIWVCSIVTEKFFKTSSGLTSREVFALSFFCGIGFTMSLFIANLAFATDLQTLNIARAGIIVGSLSSILLGTIVLLLPHTKK